MTFFNVLFVTERWFESLITLKMENDYKIIILKYLKLPVA